MLARTLGNCSCDALASASMQSSFACGTFSRGEKGKARAAYIDNQQVTSCLMRARFSRDAFCRNVAKYIVAEARYEGRGN